MSNFSPEQLQWVNLLILVVAGFCALKLRKHKSAHARRYFIMLIALLVGIYIYQSIKIQRFSKQYYEQQQAEDKALDQQSPEVDTEQYLAHFKALPENEQIPALKAKLGELRETEGISKSEEYNTLMNFYNQLMRAHFSKKKN